VQIAAVFKERIPNVSFEWLTKSNLLEHVTLDFAQDGAGVQSVITHSGRSTTVRLSPDMPSDRISNDAFVSKGTDRVYVPASSLFASGSQSPSPVAPYAAMVGGMAFSREWMYRHARNAAELGVPARSGGGPVVAIIIVALMIVAVLAEVAAAVLAVVCVAGSDAACKWAAILGTLGAILAWAAPEAQKATGGQSVSMSYGANA
jgi:hypothetical protein